MSESLFVTREEIARTILRVITGEFLCKTMFEYFRTCRLDDRKIENRGDVPAQDDLRGETSCKAIVREYGPRVYTIVSVANGRTINVPRICDWISVKRR